MSVTIHIKTRNTLKQEVPPMPKPRKNEEKSDYIARAIRYLMEKERLSQKHAVAKAYGMWKQHLKEKRK